MNSNELKIEKCVKNVGRLKNLAGDFYGHLRDMLNDVPAEKRTRFMGIMGELRGNYEQLYNELVALINTVKDEAYHARHDAIDMAADNFKLKGEHLAMSTRLHSVSDHNAALVRDMATLREEVSRLNHNLQVFQRIKETLHHQRLEQHIIQHGGRGHGD
jgi:hypothetical protein